MQATTSTSHGATQPIHIPHRLKGRIHVYRWEDERDLPCNTYGRKAWAQKLTTSAGFYLQRRVFVETRRADGNEPTPTAQRPNQSPAQRCGTQKCGEALDERNSTRYGTAATSALAFVPEVGWLGLQFVPLPGKPGERYGATTHSK